MKPWSRRESSRSSVSWNSASSAVRFRNLRKIRTAARKPFGGPQTLGQSILSSTLSWRNHFRFKTRVRVSFLVPLADLTPSKDRTPRYKTNLHWEIPIYCNEGETHGWGNALYWHRQLHCGRFVANRLVALLDTYKYSLMTRDVGVAPAMVWPDECPGRWSVVLSRLPGGCSPIPGALK